MSHVWFQNPKPIINISPVHSTSDLVLFKKSIRHGQNSIQLVNSSYNSLSERFRGIVYMQATTMGQRKPFGPCWLSIHLITIVMILHASWMDSERYPSKQLWKLLFRVADTGRQILIMLRMVISNYAKAFPWESVQIHPLEKIIGIMLSQIEAALCFAIQKLAWLVWYLSNTFAAIDIGPKVILLMYWPHTQWLIEQVTTPFRFQLSSTYIRWHYNLLFATDMDSSNDNDTDLCIVLPRLILW